MKRTFIALFISFMVVGFSFSQQTQDNGPVVIDGVKWSYSIREDGFVAIDSIPDKTQGVVRVPNKINGITVKEIKGYAFRSCKDVTDILLPEGIETILNGVFYNCVNVKKLHIPSSVKHLTGGTFEGFGGHIVVDPQNSTYATDSIGALFDKGLKTILFAPKNIKTYVLPESVKIISDYAFSGCGDLESCSLPVLLEQIGNFAFDECIRLKKLNIPSNVSRIGYYAFQKCVRLEAVELPKKIKTIDSATFWGCESLERIIIPEGVETIQSWWDVDVGFVDGYGGAFEKCINLKSIVLPKSLQKVEPGVFAHCDKIESVVFLGAPPVGIKVPVVTHCLPLDNVYYPSEYANQWIRCVGNRRLSYTDIFSNACVNTTASMLDTSRMKISYQIEFPGVPPEKVPEKVCVQAVAFKDGVRSFDNIVPIKSGESVPSGGWITTTGPHSFVWNVSKDWDIKIGKISVEILVKENELLPQELITFPVLAEDGKTKTGKEMTVSNNSVPDEVLFNALLWCYVKGDDALKVQNGVVTWNDKVLARGMSLERSQDVLAYLYGRCDLSLNGPFRVLKGAELEYAKRVARLETDADELHYRAVMVSDGQNKQTNVE